MTSWSDKRKMLYASFVIIVLLLGLGIPLFFYLYEAPTCFDGKKNGKEKGIDCGGNCTRLCQDDFLVPSVMWTRLEQVTSGVYNVATYIVNPNIFGEAVNTPYKISLFDSRGMLITEEKGFVTIPPHRNTLAFKGAVRVRESVPSRALFEFISAPDWYKKEDTLSSIVVADKYYTEEGNSSSLSVSLRNDGLNPVGRMGVYVILYDRSGNAIGFSKTIVDEILPKATVLAPFTWNKNRQGEVVSIEVLYVAE